MIVKNDAYKDVMYDTIQNIIHKRDIEDSGDLNEHVKKVAVILCGSRNGSSLLKTIVSNSNDVAYLSGEEEPFYILSGNGFPWSSDHDGFKSIKRKQFLLDNIFDELGVNTKEFNIENIIHNWTNRIPLQSQNVDSQLLWKVRNFWESADTKQMIDSGFSYKEICQVFLKFFYKGMQDFGYYDIIPENTTFLIDGANKIKIEEPPFVIPELKRPFTKQDCEDKVLIFKTPQDCYRIGIFEELFPNAEIKYIHLSRGFAQAVNGLMDGWLSETGFFAHNMDMINERLNIKGYTDVIKGGDRWWNFDLPANWMDYKDKPLEEVCLNQWEQSHWAIIESGVQSLRIKFEDFVAAPQETINTITNYLGIGHIENKKLPLIMVTETPSNFRWVKRGDIIRELAKQPKVIDLMHELGYSMDETTWI